MMKVDLELLKEAHPRLSRSSAEHYVHHAALALQRRHAPGVRAVIVMGAEPCEATLEWRKRSGSGAKMLDREEMTEHGAEAIALCIVHASRGWVVLRRLQKGEHADWLLEDPRGSRVALEVSGTDKQDVAARMRQKLDQVARCVISRLRGACVVQFVQPKAELKMLSEEPK